MSASSIANDEPVRTGNLAAAAVDRARRAVGVLSDAPGDSRLRSFQRAGAVALVRRLRAWGGALLADEVGAGKTYTAIAAAALLGGDVTVVCPAPLVESWREAVADMGFAWRVVSDGLLSRRRIADAAGGPVVVDEAHRFRNRSTHRRAALEELARGRDVLLVTATPIWRHPTDLVSLLSLAVSDEAVVRVGGLAPARFAEHVAAERGLVAALMEAFAVRRVDVRPATTRAERIEQVPTADADIVDAVEEGARGAMVLGGDPASLFASVVARRLASSPEAARSTLQRASSFLDRALEAAAVGRVLSRVEWARAFGLGDSGGEQMVFPFWYRPGAASAADALRAGRAAVGRALDALASVQTRGSAKFARLEAFMSQHGRALCFTEYATTAFAIAASAPANWRTLVVTGARCQWVGGRGIGRQTALEIASGGLPAAAQPPGLVVLTPIGSEGLNLQRAAPALVHYDQPWTHARLEQRVGRLDRIGGPARVTVLSLLPVAPSTTHGASGGTSVGSDPPADSARIRLRGGSPRRWTLPASLVVDGPGAFGADPAHDVADGDLAWVFLRVAAGAPVQLAVVGPPWGTWARSRAGGRWTAASVAEVLGDQGQGDIGPPEPIEWRAAPVREDWVRALYSAVASTELALGGLRDPDRHGWLAVARAGEVCAVGREVVHPADGSRGEPVASAIRRPPMVRSVRRALVTGRAEAIGPLVWWPSDSALRWYVAPAGSGGFT